MIRVLFYVVCILLGVGAGWWWTQQSSTSGSGVTLRYDNAPVHQDDKLNADIVAQDVNTPSRLDSSGAVSGSGKQDIPEPGAPEQVASQTEAPERSAPLPGAPEASTLEPGASEPASIALATQSSVVQPPVSPAARTPENQAGLSSDTLLDKQLAVEQENRDRQESPSESAASKDDPMPTMAVVSYYEGIMKVAPSVVSVYASNSTSEADRSSNQGSGVIVNADGVILTSLHLLEGQDLITAVLSDGRKYAARLIGSDRETDLAVVQINESNLPYVRLDDAPPLRVGDVVLAIGNPFGVGQTVTQGIVSATRRRIAGGSPWQHFIQIDAAINPGNSGGALINPYGQLVGVNTAVFRGDTGAVGIGFSIPADLLAQVVPQIINYGSVARGWLGITVEDLSLFPTLSSRSSTGAVITGVVENSPASSAGLRSMDVVTHIGEQEINGATQLLLAVSALPPGATVKVTLLRSTSRDIRSGNAQDNDLESIDLKMSLGTRPVIPLDNLR